jgi:GT2 family glycosyltransferase
MTDLSIIIVCYKGWERLLKCLGALDKFSLIGQNIEVIVVDNNSGDDTIFNIEKSFPRFRFLHNKVNGGFGNGCNLGAENAGGEFLLFLNPDTIASESEVEKLLIAGKQDPGFGIISCKQVNAKGRESVAYGSFPSMFNLTGFQRAIFRRRKAKLEENSQISLPDWISGSVVLIRKDLFWEIRGFDEDFWMYFEDVDLCKRISDKGFEIAFCRNISIEHNHGGSSRINLKTTSLTKTEVYISRHLYISKHKRGVEKSIIQIFLVINNLISGLSIALVGLILFFIPKLFSRTLIFLKLISYYMTSIAHLSWISPRSVNYPGSVKP